MNSNPSFRLLTQPDADAAARVIAQAFVDDPLCSFMLPFRATRVKTLYKFFRAYSGINIKNKRGYGSGDPLQGVAFWKSPDQENLSVSVKALGSFLPLLITMYPIGYLRAKLWEPLGMTGSAKWTVDWQRSAAAYCCLAMRAPDLLRFGQFVHNRAPLSGPKTTFGAHPCAFFRLSCLARGSSSTFLTSMPI